VCRMIKSLGNMQYTSRDLRELIAFNLRQPMRRSAPISTLHNGSLRAGIVEERSSVRLLVQSDGVCRGG